ncbi:TPA: EexN family lipoprotein [Escherichia coli]|uniref:Entry exclusion protein n=1 Tax=Salmonella enterica TaxID=28901 RepID=A0A5U1I9Q7_SALER|nr:EexN family lipoprotein [Escherichia coli]EBJ1476613.1 entry exclusion protein [Salmonella enterica]ELK0758966.1 EexN family lipoprotein [Klebsiella oxytoca]HBQ6287071.1 EexN family lipoprotein [Klebsiella pneumoniae]EBO7105329.1 entry exclusion protein [Salmonella enterica]EFA3977584.1 entry exclusion protein [Escherichia coli]
MKSIATAGLVIISVFSLSGCFEETKSVDWWKEHHDESLKKEIECKKTGSDSQNCRNVKEANFRYQQLHSTPPSFKDAFKKMEKEQSEFFKEDNKK